ncbi:MAG: carbon-nitrogen hydrolase family protein [Clostridia bacterium]|nr:carbon-nitrogen hydrolase family protein [Clostridia bacterium]
MDICFVTDCSINTIWQEKLGEVGKQDLVVFGFNGLGLVSYKKELDGKTEYFQDLAKLSKQLSTVIISGADTDSYGEFHHSAVIADKGKLLGVSDSVHTIDDAEFSSGGNYRVYETSIGKIGIIILDDLYFNQSINVLSLCDADIIVCLQKKLSSLMPQVLLRAGAFLNGVVMALCAENYAMVSNVRGDVVLSGTSNIVKGKIKLDKKYTLITSKGRGVFRNIDSSY